MYPALTGLALQKVEVNVGPSRGAQKAKLAGVVWLELDRDDVLSEPVPVLVTPNIDVVDEVNSLEDDLDEAR